MNIEVANNSCPGVISYGEFESAHRSFGNVIGRLPTDENRLTRKSCSGDSFTWLFLAVVLFRFVFERIDRVLFGYDGIETLGIL